MSDLAPKLKAGRFAITLQPDARRGGRRPGRQPGRDPDVDVTFREGLRLEQIDGQARHAHGHAGGPGRVLCPRDQAHRRPARGLPVAPRRDRPARGRDRSRASCTRRRTPLRIDQLEPTDAEELVRMMLDAFYERVGPERLAVPDARGAHLLPGPDARLDRGARGGPRRGAADDRRRLPEPDRPGDRASSTACSRPTRRSSTRSTPSTWAPTARTGRSTCSGRCPRARRCGTRCCRTRSPGTTPTSSGGCRRVPIATPSLASIDAALVPDTKSGFTYFVAIPEGKGAHDFSKSLAEHEKKLEEVRVLGR